MKKIKFSILIVFGLSTLNAQTGHEIKINLKNSKDTIAYLTFYQFDKNMIVDTCKTIKNGKIVFKGKKTLENGIYSLISQGKSILFDFVVDQNTQKSEINAEVSTNFLGSLSSVTSPDQNAFFDYMRFVDSKKKTFDDIVSKTKGMTKTDSTAFMKGKQKPINESISEYEISFVNQHKGTYIGDVLNLKAEKMLKEIPKASNGRPDSIAVFKYYKQHFWDNVDFKDDGIVRTPFFTGRLKQYLDNVVIRHPDSVSVEIDKIMNKAKPGSLIYKLMLAHFTNTYETSKIMGFDKVFVHIAETYFKTGKANDLYNDDNIVKNIVDRAAILKPLLIDAIAPDLPMIAVEDREKIKKMGFETAKTSEDVTKLYYANTKEIEQTFLHLNTVKADYMLLVFWDVDCSHCMQEIPKLLDLYHEIKAIKDLKVYAVYTQHELDKYQKYIAEKKLDWINVYDGVHFTNLKDKYDIFSTPVIYILDKNKKIKAKRVGIEQIKDILNVIELEYKEKAKNNK